MQITSRLYTVNKHDIELRNDLINLKQEMIGISIVDEFSKYAKLQRKYNKLESTLKEKGKIMVQLIQLLRNKLDLYFIIFLCNNLS